jgi:predicted metal-binding membrane protein
VEGSPAPSAGENRRPIEVRADLVLLAALGLAAAGAWAFTVWNGAGMSSAMFVMLVSTGTGFAVFLGIWMVMMVAMMFPAAAPMARTYVALSSRGVANASWRAPLSLAFLGTYTAVWTATGVIAAAAYLILAGRVPEIGATGTLGVAAAGAVLVLAGIYQATPLKQACLRGCRSPLSFLMVDWRPGVRGAIRLGARHAAYCVGCCWLLFVVLFAVGVMALPWMALIALAIFLEKSIPGRAGAATSAGVGGALVVVGLIFLALPGAGAWALGLS